MNLGIVLRTPVVGEVHRAATAEPPGASLRSGSRKMSMAAPEKKVLHGSAVSTVCYLNVELCAYLKDWHFMYHNMNSAI